MPRRATPDVEPAIASAEEEALLCRGAAQLGVSLDEVQLVQLRRYQALLAEWSAKMNLTAVRDPREVIVRHFLDSLALLRALPTQGTLPEPTLVDIGSGAGFPGVFCALFRSDLHVTLVERIGKKAAFLSALRRELGLKYEVEALSAERLPGGYGVAVSRAALPLPDWLLLAGRLVAPRGYVFAMTTPREPLPKGPEFQNLELLCDVTYDVGAGPRRILGYKREF